MQDLDSIQSVLQSGKLDQLIGLPENEWLEAKSCPYDLEQEYSAYELVKDVTSLANADGGLIIIGVRTEKDELSAEDSIKEIRPLARDLVNIEQYCATISGRTYPPMKDVKIEWMPGEGTQEKGVIVITVAASGESYPVLVTKVVDDTWTPKTLFGYYERRRSHNLHLSIHELHARIKDGFKFELLNERLKSIEETVNRLQKLLENREPYPSIAIPPGPSGAEIKRRIEGLLRDVELEGKPSMALAAAPATSVTIPSLTVSQSETVEVLTDPPTVRRSGFDLGRYQSAPLLDNGERRRAIMADYKALEIWHDGAFLFVATAGDEFLSWSRSRQASEPFVINTLVLAESCYLFCITYQKLTALMDPTPEYFEYRLEVRRMEAPGNPPIIRAEKMLNNPLYSSPPIPAPYGGEIFNLSAPADQLPEITAFQLLRQFYLWFGIEEDRIPYTIEDAGTRKVDIEEIKNIGIS